MSLIPRSNLFDIDRLLGDTWPMSYESQRNTFFAPRVDIEETGEGYEITAELPGVSRENIQVHVRDGVLTLEAETSRESKEEKAGKLLRQERRYGKYMRSFNLGMDIHEEDIKASFKDGVLTLAAPKRVAKEPERRRIEVS